MADSNPRPYIPPYVILIGVSIAVLLFIIAVIYFLVRAECDGIFWGLLIIAIIIGIVTSILSFVNHFLLKRKIVASLQNCRPDPLAKRLLSSSLLSPWVGAILSAISIGLYIAAIVYYVVTNNCDGWFFGLMVPGFIFVLLAGLWVYSNHQFHLTIQQVELEQCAADPSVKYTVYDDDIPRITSTSPAMLS